MNTFKDTWKTFKKYRTVDVKVNTPEKKDADTLTFEEREDGVYLKRGHVYTLTKFKTLEELVIVLKVLDVDHLL
jgi:hypothetical protein